MTEQLANSVYNPTAQLSAGIAAGDLSLMVSDVSEFIDTNGDPLVGEFRVLLWDGSTDASKEVVKVGAFDSGTGICSSLTRAVEGKNPAMDHAAGDLVELVITAGGLEDYVSASSIVSALLSFSVGTGPAGIAFTPDGTKAYVCNATDGTVTPVDVATDTPGVPFSVDLVPLCVAFTPDGTKAYVANFADWTVTPVDVATDTPAASIPGFGAPEGIAITPDGATAYVTNNNAGDSSVTPIDVATDTPGTPISVGESNNPWGIAVSPDGQKLYVCINNNGTVLPIALPSETPGTPMAVGGNPAQVAFSPDGTKAYVTDSNGFVVPINAATDTPGTPIDAGGQTNSLAFSASGETLYFVVGNLVGRIDVATDTLLPAVTGTSGFGSGAGLAFAPDGTKAYVSAGDSNAVHIVARLPYRALV